jgi:DNA polymerase III epsilon subunit-like protein
VNLEPTGFLPMALCDRAYALLSQRAFVAEEVLLAHVYGGAPPVALRARLAEPLLADPRIVRRADGQWTLVGQAAAVDKGQNPRELAFTALALAATGPSPARGRVVHLAGLHVCDGTTLERFSATVHPGKRVPRYVAERIGLATELLDDLPPFAAMFDELVRFLGTRPVIAQDARLTWAFIEAEARRLGQVLPDRVLIDANELATQLLDLRSKPTLALVAAQLEIGMHRVPRPDEEARVLGLVMGRLLAIAAESHLLPGLATVFEARPSDDQTVLRSGEVLKAMAETPGIYVLRDSNETPLYIGKARRLRSRVAAYVQRPLGTTRRLEGLVSAVQRVEAVDCATDLEALILEDREIRRLQPRFNTVRQQRAPRLWIRLPRTVAAKGKKRAPVRLELSLGPGSDQDGEFVGPFRNETLADRVRFLARKVFALDTLRRDNPEAYFTELGAAWGFLNGDTDAALARVRSSLELGAFLGSVLNFDRSAALLPADPRAARYAVLRPTPTATGIEGFLLDRGILQSWVTSAVENAPFDLAGQLLSETAPHTHPEDADVVLRWFGAQRPPACLVHLPDDPVATADRVQDAALALADRLAQARSSGVENALESPG